MDASNLVEINCVTKRFGEGAPALDEVRADIKPGLITGLVGSDGAGKTTLIRLLAGLLVPDSGSINAFGLDTVNDTAALHCQMGYMPQRFGLYEDLSVRENLRLYADLQGVPAEEEAALFARLLDFTGLHKFQERLAGRLSGGMKQKLGLACALLRQPRLLLLDEPSVGVDPLSRRELWKMVRLLASAQTCILWSTSYLDEAERCDEVLLLNAGKLLFAGEPRQLSRRVSGRTFLVRNISGSRRKLLEAALRQDGIKDCIIQGQSVRLVVDEGKAAPAADGLGDAGAHIVSVEPRFEDAFVDLLNHRQAHESALAKLSPTQPDIGKPVVLASGLTKRFGSFVAADDISFSIPAGRIFGLLGPNGAGKSTTFKMMCGLLKPCHGQALVDGVDLQAAPGRARARLGYMAQKFSLYGNLSVAQNLDFFASVYGLSGSQKREKIELLASLFGLGQYAKASAGDLPLGYKQRLALSCAVMHNPVALFLDEPTSGVDPLTRREFWLHINGLVEKGVAVVVTTHFMDEAEYCDDIGLIYRGRMIASGPPDALKAGEATAENPEPTLEDAFISLIQRFDAEHVS